MYKNVSFFSLTLTCHFNVHRESAKGGILQGREFRRKGEPIKVGKLLRNVINPQLSKDLLIRVCIY